MKSSRLLFLSVLLSCFTLLPAQNTIENYIWKPLNPAGEAVGRHENAFVQFQGKFYLIGGRGVKPVNVYDPVNNTWETKGKTPMEIHHFQAVWKDDVIYIVGAMTGKYPKETPVENIWEYYPKEDKWVKGPKIPMEYQRGSAGAVLYQDKIYLIGGIEYGHTSGTTNRFDYYDLNTKKWGSLTKAPHLRDHFSAVLFNQKIYCVGGRNTSVHHPDNFTAFFGATIPEVDVYDFATDKWMTLKYNLPVPTAAGGAVQIHNKIIYFGGESGQDKAHNETQCLDLETLKWSQLSPLKIGRHGSTAIYWDNKVYIAAGSPNRGGGNMSSIEVFTNK
ncbi:MULTISPECIES: Kelch repeat-containing protein [unclassified Saccharicrinis]|uniref:Kelch repeat-containing protein n=1 Tax=unclassified Saccharicrinis TaxID=2646859 RepID=UPI003D347C42